MLSGGVGNDTINALGGDDIVSGGAGNDRLDGGTGIDTLQYGELTNAVQVNLVTGQVNAGVQGGVDTVSNFENVILGSGNDQFIGDGNANVVEGGAGDDQIDGGGGSDTVVFRNTIAVDGMARQAFDVLQVNASASGLGSDTLTNVEHISFVNPGETLDVLVVGGNAVVAERADAGGVRQLGDADRRRSAGRARQRRQPRSGLGRPKVVSAVAFGTTVGTIGQPLVGAYGTLTLYADGSYTYVANENSRALPENVTAQDVFTYTADDGDLGDSIPTTLTITITGDNDLASAGGVRKGDVTEDVNVTNNHLTATGTLTATDPDAGESQFRPVQSVVGANGYGTFTLAANGVWTFNADNSLAAIQSLRAGEMVADTFKAFSADGTAGIRVKVDITGTNDQVTLTGGTLATVTDTAATDSYTATSGQIANPNKAAGPMVGTLSDADAGDIYSYRLIGTPDATYGTFALRPTAATPSRPMPRRSMRSSHRPAFRTRRGERQ